VSLLTSSLLSSPLTSLTSTPPTLHFTPNQTETSTVAKQNPPSSPARASVLIEVTSCPRWPVIGAQWMGRLFLRLVRPPTLPLRRRAFAAPRSLGRSFTLVPCPCHGSPGPSTLLTHDPGQKHGTPNPHRSTGPCRPL
jgi:hypothetical protein